MQPPRKSCCIFWSHFSESPCLFGCCLQSSCLIFVQNHILNLFTGFRIDWMCNISILPVCCLMAMKSPFSPSITLISWMTNSLSKVMETIAFILPSFSIFLTLTSVICIFPSPFPLVNCTTVQSPLFRVFLTSPNNAYAGLSALLFADLPSWNKTETAAISPAPAFQPVPIMYSVRFSQLQSLSHPECRYM